MSKHYGPWRSGPMSLVLATPVGKLASHWLVQSLLYMDRSERRFKIGLDVLVGLALFTTLRRRIGRWRGAIVGALLAHTANFILNGHVWAVLKWHGLGNRSAERLLADLQQIANRLNRSAAIQAVLVYGSLSRDELHAGSDLDIRVLRTGGKRSALVACALVTLERARALVSGLPLDIYVWDTPVSARSMRKDEEPISIPPGWTATGAGCTTPEDTKQQARLPRSDLPKPS